ncbi:hypothetical protein BU17DRAFT_95476 [Hysterangium stoloniferum]|nr:hypothetical protein BU17DRAFT_104200 [Hysterangium stoloniferum]KAF8513321.1 hypothetical protein BU17DRAFT_95471 [Hysterangium stoloniferum]KAF8513324.1 hypothetical protein BU17DRAFT_95476 [Hysterangium stoloniferum]
MLLASNIQRVENPTEELFTEVIELFYELMKDDIPILSLTGGDKLLIRPMTSAIIRACALEGEFYTATDPATGVLTGYAVWMPPGHELFDSEAQRKLGLNDFMKRLSDAGQNFYTDIYLKKFPGFVDKCLESTGRRNSWWLHQIMVRTENQRQGIARTLIDFIKRKAAERHERVALSVTSENTVSTMNPISSDSNPYSVFSCVQAVVYTSLEFTPKGRLELSSPWGDYPLIVFTFDT